MSSILNSEDFGLKIYNRFPPKYREDDVSQKFALKRYLQSLSDGGFKYSIDEINGITHLIDPDKVQSEVLPILFKQYGLNIFNGIPEEYLRYLLPKLGEAWSKKGSLSVVEFITSSLSGIKTSTNVWYDEFNDPIIDVKLEMDYSLGDYFPDVKQFTRLLKNFIPFYCDMSLIYSYLFYETQVLRSKDDYNLFVIKDHREEKGLIPYTIGKRGYPQLGVERELLNSSLLLNKDFVSDIDPDYHKDKLVMTPLIESVGITKKYSTKYLKNSLNNETLNRTLILSEYLETDYNMDSISLQVAESSKVSEDEVDKTILSVLLDESGSVRSRGVQTSETTSILGQAVLGVAVLDDNDEENADVFEDFITYDTNEPCNLTKEYSMRYFEGSLNLRTLNSSFILNGHERTDYYSDSFRVSPFSETSKTSVEERVKDELKMTHIESGSFVLELPLKDSEQSALLGEAVMGVSVFGVKNEEADTNIDNIKSTEEDIGKLFSPIDTRLNSHYNTLNSDFFTNGLYCYDIVTVNGVREVII